MNKKIHPKWVECFFRRLTKNYESFSILCRNWYEHLFFADVSSSLNLVAVFCDLFFRQTCLKLLVKLWIALMKNFLLLSVQIAASNKVLRPDNKPCSKPICSWIIWSCTLFIRQGHCYDVNKKIGLILLETQKWLLWAHYWTICSAKRPTGWITSSDLTYRYLSFVNSSYLTGAR